MMSSILFKKKLTETTQNNGRKAPPLLFTQDRGDTKENQPKRNNCFNMCPC